MTTKDMAKRPGIQRWDRVPDGMVAAEGGQFVLSTDHERMVGELRAALEPFANALGHIRTDTLLSRPELSWGPGFMSGDFVKARLALSQVSEPEVEFDATSVNNEAIARFPYFGEHDRAHAISLRLIFTDGARWMFDQLRGRKS